MRIVWFAAAFILGASIHVASNIELSGSIPDHVFWPIALAIVSLTIASILLLRNTTLAVLPLVVLLGIWRASVAVEDPISSNNFTSGLLEAVRSNITQSLDTLIGGDAGGLSNALVTGDRSGLSNQITDAFRAAGLSHILAISGLHIGLIGGVAISASTAVFGKNRRLYLLAPLLVVTLYAALSGLAPPVTRATIMFIAFVVGRLLGRGSHMLAAIAFAAAAMVAVQPHILSSLSFQLSFAAVLGIALVAKRFDPLSEVAVASTDSTPIQTLKSKLLRFVVGSLVVSLAATAATAPLIAIHFGEMPLWGPIATIFVLPAIPVLILSSIAVPLIDVLAPEPIAYLFALPALVAANYAIIIAESAGRLPPGPIPAGDITVWFAVAYYVTIMAAATQSSRIQESLTKLARKHNVKASFRMTESKLATSMPYALSLLLIPLGIVFLVAADINQSTPTMDVTFLDMTRGESILIQAPNGKRMLIDAGGTPHGAADAISSAIPVWDRSIDIALLTHPDADHINGMSAVIQRINVGLLIEQDLDADSLAFSEWRETADRHGRTIAPVEGMKIKLDRDATVEILAAGCAHPSTPCSNRNDASVVAKASFGNVSFLLTGDIETAAEASLVSSGKSVHASVLKAPHHGSRTSSSELLLDAVSPAVAVIAVGSENPFGHPHSEVVERLIAAVGEERLLRTDEDGTLTLRTDGHRLWLKR